MLTITKKEIRELLKDIKWTVKNTTDKFYTAGAYIFNDKINLFASYHGESIDGNYYNKLYDASILLDSIIEMYIDNEYDLVTATNITYDDIIDMIEDYKENKIAIGNNIKNILDKKNISMRKMANDLGIDYSVIHALVKRPSLGTTDLERVVMIADYLDVNIKELY